MKKVGLHVSLETQTAVCLPKKKTMEKEIWRPIKGYEGWYEVSSYGNVRSVDRVVVYSNERKHFYKGQILRLSKDKDGYLQCNLAKNKKNKLCKVHRLVAYTFIPNSNNLPIINHKDVNPSNNHVDNLEWCTYSYNNCYANALQRRVKKRSKTVLQIDKETGQVIAEYPSAREASRQLHIIQGAISACCRGIKATYKGFKWRYKE